MPESITQNDTPSSRRKFGTFKLHLSDIVFDGVVIVVMVIVVIVTLYPFYNVLVVSFNESSDAARGGIYLFPRHFSVDSYRRILESTVLYDAFLVTVLRTVFGTVITIFFSSSLAYALSKDKLVGRSFYFLFFLIAYLFNGGLIPTYMVIRAVGLIDTFAVYILPYIINIGIVLLLIMFFRQIPKELEESATIDGANHFVIFLRVYVPLSLPAIATMSLFQAVFHWNMWFDSMIYISSRKLYVLQYILRTVLAKAQLTSLEQAKSTYNHMVSPLTVQAAITIVTTVPIIMVYPFLQKYFVKGLIVGAIKG